MTRAKKERTPKSAERLKLMRTNAGLSQAGFEEKTGIPQQAISRYERNERPLERIDAEKAIAAFPDYRLDWLLGKDDSMTHLEKSRSAILDARREGALLDGGFRLLAELAGFSIEDPIMGDEIEEVVANLHEGMLVSRNGQSTRLTIEQLNRIENQVLDFAEFLLVKAIS